eukprot:TRINITY_DN10455_c0_g1_i1.p1 TRINITY_DN10455_c0_g1~~TRINITY_DN10455_c0_g1_i1.p1  ORF type:complete len:188 (-),score=59.98 TRINITY_DN10455_c0_g1_i1:76-639(-)
MANQAPQVLEKMGVGMNGLLKNVKKISTEFHVWYPGSAVYELRKMFNSNFAKQYPDIEFEESEKEFHELKQNKINIHFDTGEHWTYEGRKCNMSIIRRDLKVYMQSRQRHEYEKIMKEAAVEEDNAGFSDTFDETMEEWSEKEEERKKSLVEARKKLIEKALSGRKRSLRSVLFDEEFDEDLIKEEK